MQTKLNVIVYKNTCLTTFCGNMAIIQLMDLNQLSISNKLKPFSHLKKIDNESSRMT